MCPKETTISADENRVRYLIDKMYQQTELYWKRANILLVLNAAVIGGVAKLITESKSWSIFYASVYVFGALAGCLLSIFWQKMQSVSKMNEERWFYDAKRILSAPGNEELLQKYKYSFGLHGLQADPADPLDTYAEDKGFKPPVTPKINKASSWMNAVIWVIIAIWCLFLVHGCFTLLDLWLKF